MRRFLKQAITQPGILPEKLVPSLWETLSDVFGDRVTKRNFQAAIERQLIMLIGMVISPGRKITENLSTAWLWRKLPV